MLLLLAWKNIWRNKKRSLIILAAIALGLWAGLFSVAISMGVWEATVNATIDRNLSHVQIHTEEFKDEKLISNYIPDGSKVVEEIREDTRIKEVSGRVLIEGMASSPTSSGKPVTKSTSKLLNLLPFLILIWQDFVLNI